MIELTPNDVKNINVNGYDTYSVSPVKDWYTYSFVFMLSPPLTYCHPHAGII